MPPRGQGADWPLITLVEQAGQAGGRAAELGYLDGVAAPAVMMLSWP
jgi:hypothetical protein